jgi:hypothetical protein
MFGVGGTPLAISAFEYWNAPGTVSGGWLKGIEEEFGVGKHLKEENSSSADELAHLALSRGACEMVLVIRKCVARYGTVDEWRRVRTSKLAVNRNRPRQRIVCAGLYP